MANRQIWFLTGTAALRKLEIENQAVEVPYAAKFDQLDVKLTEINLNGQKPSHAGLVLADAAVVRKSESEPVLSLQKLSVEEVAIDPMQQSAVLGTVTLDRFKTSMRREADGRLDLVKLFSSPPGKTAPIPVTTPWPLPKRRQLSHGRLGLAACKLVAAALRFEDSTLTNVAPMVVDPLDLTCQRYRLQRCGAAEAGAQGRGKSERAAWKQMVPWLGRH